MPTEVDAAASFTHLLSRERPDLLKLDRVTGEIEIVEGTTVLALCHAGGVVIAGDRRATEGSFIAHRSIEKVFMADSHSGVAIAGAAGPALEMVRLFQTELEHYEKVQGRKLSLEGKANRLATLIRNNFPMAVQGLVVVPVFAGYDLTRSGGRIYKYDMTGGRYEELSYHAEGSGGRIARSYIKLHFSSDIDEEEAVRVAVGALYEAADEDSGTGGPDLARGIFPTVAIIDADGFRSIPEETVAERFDQVLSTFPFATGRDRASTVGRGAPKQKQPGAGKGRTKGAKPRPQSGRSGGESKGGDPK